MSVQRSTPPSKNKYPNRIDETSDPYTLSFRPNGITFYSNRPKETPISERQNSVYNHDFSYWDEVFKNTDYEGIYNSIKAKYQIEIPQTALGELTGKNKESYYNHILSMNDELSALRQKMYDEDYQSPAEEVKRNNLAGINSDLSGLQGTPASESSPKGVPDMSVNNDLQTVGNVAGVFFQALNIAKGLTESSVNLVSRSLDNQNKRIEVAQNAFNFGRSAGLKMLSPDKSEEAQSQNANIIQGFATLSGIKKRRLKRQVTHGLVSALHGNELHKKFYSDKNDGTVARENAFLIEGSSGYSDEDKVYLILSENLANLRQDAKKAEYQKQSDEAVERSGQSQFKTDLNTTLRDVVSSLSDEAKNGNNFASSLLVVLQILLAKSGI